MHKKTGETISEETYDKLSKTAKDNYITIPPMSERTVKQLQQNMTPEDRVAAINKLKKRRAKNKKARKARKANK